LLIYFAPSAGRLQQTEVSHFWLALCPEVAEATQLLH